MHVNRLSAHTLHTALPRRLSQRRCCSNNYQCHNPDHTLDGNVVVRVLLSLCGQVSWQPKYWIMVTLTQTQLSHSAPPTLILESSRCVHHAYIAHMLFVPHQHNHELYMFTAGLIHPFLRSITYNGVIVMLIISSQMQTWMKAPRVLMPPWRHWSYSTWSYQYLYLLVACQSVQTMGNDRRDHC